MGWRGFFIVLAALATLSAVPVFAQPQAPSEQLTLTAKLAATWTHERENIVLLHGPVRIVFDRADAVGRQRRDLADACQPGEL